jgi:hypothetical protein
MIFKRSTAILSLMALTAILLGACTPTALSTATTTSDPVNQAATTAPMIESAPALEAATQVVPASAPAVVELNASYENAVSIEQQLILGTIKLEGTNLAISKEQAAILIPLYTNLKTIVESMMPAQGTRGDSATKPQEVNAETQTQIDAIIKNILATLTPEQVKAISEMKITHEIAQSIMTEKGISMGGPGQGKEMPGANGQPPQGTPPVGGPNGGAGVPSSDGTKGQQPGGGMIPSELISTLIQLLQSK